MIIFDDTVFEKRVFWKTNAGKNTLPVTEYRVTFSDKVCNFNIFFPSLCLKSLWFIKG